MLKKCISGVLSVIVILVQLPINVHANSMIVDSVNNYVFEMSHEDILSATDTAVASLRNIQEIVKKDGIQLNIYENNLPEKVDLGSTCYIPEVGLQVGGTCSSFSTTYYQYSYEVNRMNGITSKKDRVVYSPYYPFSYASAYIVDNYMSLKERGSITFNEWMKEHEDQWIASGAGIYCSSDKEAMREALKTRVSHYYEYVESHEDYEIGDSEAKVRVIKTLLANDIMLVTGVNQDSLLTYKAEKTNEYANIGEEFVVRIGATYDGAHAVTIIGYDDNKGIDINGDRKITGAEKGAFKVRNSWGEDAHDKGEYWVLYDAIVNSKSEIETSNNFYENTINPLTGKEVVRSVPDVELRKNVIKSDDSNEKQESIIEYSVYVDNIKSVSIRTGEGEKLAEFLTLKNIPTIPKNPNGLYVKQWLMDCMKEVCGGEFDINEKKIYEEYIHKVEDKWRMNLLEYCEDQDEVDDIINVLPKNWEEILARGYGERGRMFTRETTSLSKNNYYCFIKVDRKNVQLVGEVNYQLDNYWNYQLNFYNKDMIKKSIGRNEQYDEDGVNLDIESTEFIDLTELIANKDYLIGQQTWIAELSLKNGNNSSYFNFQLTDDVGNIIGKGFSSDIVDGKRTAEITTNLQLADLDYNGLLEIDDLELVWNAVKKNEKLSVLQEILADYDENNIVNSSDFNDILICVKESINKDDTSFVNISDTELNDFIEKCSSNISAGDSDYDGYITVNDFENIRYYLMGDTSFNALQVKLFDYNNDGIVDRNDVLEMLDKASAFVLGEKVAGVNITVEELYGVLGDFGYTRLGDVTMDGIINGRDIVMLKDVLSGAAYNNLQKILGDVNKDGEITWEDVKQLCKETLFVDVDGDGLRDFEDIEMVREHFLGDELSYIQQNRVDFNGNGRIDTEEFYMLLYGYYLNADTNPALSKEEFYSNVAVNYNWVLGDLNQSGKIDETDLELFNNALSGQPASYLHLILADVNKDLKLDEADKEIFLSQYMSDIPFTYTLDEVNHTMTLTGAKDNTITCMKILGEYYVNQTAYIVTAIAENAFSDCANLEEVYIPSSVTQIAGDKVKESPFYGIKGFSLKIYCEASSKSSGYAKYWNASCMVKYGYTVKNIEDYFEYTADEENKTITITGVKEKSYRDTDGVITVDDRYLVNGAEYRVTAIDDYAFYYVGNGGDMKSVELPAGITVIGEWAFADNEYVEDIDLGRCRHLKEIKASAFAYCPNLYEIWIPESVEYIHADTLEDSMIYESNEDIVIYVEAGTAGENWGAYWNYIQDKMEAETVYMGNAA